MSNIRKFENFHILLWLLKDISWLMSWRGLGVFMILQTLLCAFFITWKNRKITAEIYHNLAIIFWIIANSYWMITDFFEISERLKIFALIPFAIGLLILATYYFKEFILKSNSKSKNSRHIF